jgi:hypothetical protein
MSTATIDPKFATAIVHAVRKGLDAGVAREELRPGVYHDIEVDVTIKVGEMRVGPDTDKAPTSSIPMLTALALLVKRMGIQREDALQTLREVMVEALDVGADAQRKLLEESGVAEAEQRIRDEVIAKLPRLPVKGAVLVEGVEVVVRQMRARP